MPFPLENQTTSAILRMSIHGYWKAADFAHLLNMIDCTYDGLNAVFFFADTIRYETAYNRRVQATKNIECDSTIQDLWHGTERTGSQKGTVQEVTGKPGLPVESLVKLVKEYSGSLDLDNVSYRSPGCIELFGNVNPLKVMAEAITDWRAQNTLHRKEDGTGVTAEEGKSGPHADFQRRHIQGDVLRAVLNSSPELWTGNNGRITEVSEKIISPAGRAIADIARDSRVIGVSLNVCTDRRPSPLKQAEGGLWSAPTGGSKGERTK